MKDRQFIFSDNDEDDILSRIPPLFALAFLAGALMVGTPGHTQGYGTGNRAQTMAPQSVESVIRGFTEGARRLCGNVPDPAYTVDCVADYFDWLADRLPQDREFREAETIIRDAARQLNRVARDNASTTKRPAMLRLSDSSAQSARTSREVIPVAPDRQGAARAAAVAIVQEAETRLLRAADRSQRRRVAYSSIAAAVGNSSLILLRSG
ncbi:hypothetical protein [Marivita sp.]|uniref:hypothetical protein n=1 Tax=Marivita sp. TaxID=2003365 RepID=UPI0025BA2F52|nr:hypothetical protein [Marivita sp.]